MEARKNHGRHAHVADDGLWGEERQAAGRMGDDNSRRRYPTGYRARVSPTTARPNLPLIEASLESVLNVANRRKHRQGQREIARAVMPAKVASAAICQRQLYTCRAVSYLCTKEWLMKLLVTEHLWGCRVPGKKSFPGLRRAGTTALRPACRRWGLALLAAAMPAMLSLPRPPVVRATSVAGRTSSGEVGATSRLPRLRA